MIVMIWILQLFPARPKLAPIYNAVTHMVPPHFPLLLVIPALAVDLVLRRRTQSSSNDWIRAALSGVAFVASSVRGSLVLRRVSHQPRSPQLLLRGQSVALLRSARPLGVPLLGRSEGRGRESECAGHRDRTGRGRPHRYRLDQNRDLVGERDVSGPQVKARRLRIGSLLALVLLCTAHVGSPDVWYEGDAGPYHVIVYVRVPGVVPGHRRHQRPGDRRHSRHR